MHRARLRRLPLGAILTLALVTLHAGAGSSSDGALPVVAARTLTGSGAVSFRFVVPDGESAVLTLDVEYDRASAIGAGIWLFDGEERLVTPFAVTGLISEPGQLYLSGPQPVGTLVDIRPQGQRIPAVLSMPIDLFGPGTYVAAIGSASDGTILHGAATLQGSDGVALLGETSSDHAFFHLQRSFTGVNAIVSNDVGLMIDTTVVEQVEGRLFGSFDLQDEFVLVGGGWDGPEGSERGRLFFFEGEPPGTYVFRVDLALSSTILRLWGIDVSLAADSA